MRTVILLVLCPDQPGIVARIASLIFAQQGNIVNADQHSAEDGTFMMRLEFEPAGWDKADMEARFANLAAELCGSIRVAHSDHRPRMGVFVGKEDHCLLDILYHHRLGELPVSIPLVASNHDTLQGVVESAGIPFLHVPVAGDKRAHLEQMLRAIELTDFLVLARYMQVLDGEFLRAYRGDILNIHHSFLPSFKGANPYRQAYERGVKVIGATAHFVTAELDEGPIITQMVERVSHRDSEADLRRKGRALERVALDAAIRAYVDHRVIRHGHKTVVFD